MEEASMNVESFIMCLVAFLGGRNMWGDGPDGGMGHITTALRLNIWHGIFTDNLSPPLELPKVTVYVAFTGG